MRSLYLCFIVGLFDVVISDTTIRSANPKIEDPRAGMMTQESSYSPEAGVPYPGTYVWVERGIPTGEYFDQQPHHLAQSPPISEEWVPSEPEGVPLTVHGLDRGEPYSDQIGYGLRRLADGPNTDSMGYAHRAYYGTYGEERFDDQTGSDHRTLADGPNTDSMGNVHTAHHGTYGEKQFVDQTGSYHRTHASEPNFDSVGYVPDAHPATHGEDQYADENVSNQSTHAVEPIFDSVGYVYIAPYVPDAATTHTVEPSVDTYEDIRGTTDSLFDFSESLPSTDAQEYEPYAPPSPAEGSSDSFRSTDTQEDERYTPSSPGEGSTYDAVWDGETDYTFIAISESKSSESEETDTSEERKAMVLMEHIVKLNEDLVRYIELHRELDTMLEILITSHLALSQMLQATENSWPSCIEK